MTEGQSDAEPGSFSALRPARLQTGTKKGRPLAGAAPSVRPRRCATRSSTDGPQPVMKGRISPPPFHIISTAT